jgi:large subunit ribosomal protein L23
MKNAWRVILRPVVTEKSTREAQGNVHTFMVAMDATKHDIRVAVQTAFGVKVERVHTARIKGKPKKMRNMRLFGRRSDVKKAYVKLKEGSRLDLI